MLITDMINNWSVALTYRKKEPHYMVSDYVYKNNEIVFSLGEQSLYKIIVPMTDYTTDINFWGASHHIVLFYTTVVS